MSVDEALECCPVVALPGARHRLLRVLVVSSSELVRAGLVEFLSSGSDHLRAVDIPQWEGQSDEFDVALYDLARLVDPPEELADLIAQRPVIGLGLPGRRDLTERALAAGVSAVVPHSVTPEDLLETIEQVADGDHETLADFRRRCRRELMEAHQLSERELTVLELIATGVGNHDIAAELWLSINSVKSHIRSAYRKIGATSRSQAILWAVRHDVPRTSVDPALPVGEDPS